MNNMERNLKYLAGFNNYHQSEAIPSSLPTNKCSPQQAPLGLYAEQLSGSAFTAARQHTKLSWCYRVQPSVVHEPFEKFQHPSWQSPPYNQDIQTPNQYRWSPEIYPDAKNNINFLMGVKSLAGFGDPKALTGACANLFFANRSMSSDRLYFSNHDAELLIVMQAGKALFTTEFGELIVSADDSQSEIIVIPRGIRFKVDLISETIRGYIAENFGSPFELPELGVIGANCLANPRHFLYPTAAFENADNKSCTWVCKYQGSFFETTLNNSPCNVVAWHGNYAPYKYNLDLYNTLNTVSFDHPDPSIFTVLTSPSVVAGVANLDFVIFPPRWMVATETFRLPYFHRNIMSEFMGLIRGVYDAKPDGFLPGGYSLHNRMTPHGPDCNSTLAAEQVDLKPEYYHNTLAFMLESNLAWDVTEYALNSSYRQKDYYRCWQKLPARYSKK